MICRLAWVVLASQLALHQVRVIPVVGKNRQLAMDHPRVVQLLALKTQVALRKALVAAAIPVERVIVMLNSINGQVRYIPTTVSKAKCIVLIILVLCIYTLDFPCLGNFFNNQYASYILKPLLWLGIALMVYSFPRVRPKAKIRYNKFLNWWAFNFAVVFISASFVIGIVDGLGKSPYDHSLQGITINLIAVGSFLLATELVRYYLVNSLTKKENYLVFMLVASFIALSSISPNHYMKIKDFEGVVKFAAQYVAPEFCHNLLATYLAFLGGPLPSLIYMGLIKAFNWFSPILPNFKWLTAALVGVLCPVFSLGIMQNAYLSEAKLLKAEDKEEENPLGWIATTLTSIAIIWFAVGVFPIYPSVIATGSMEPLIKPGDVILVKKAYELSDLENFQVGDILQFERDGILISHRIIEIIEKDGNKSFHTKGDNNSVPDHELIKPEQVRGVIVKVVPKVGWPTLLMKNNKDIPLDRVQF